MSRWIRKSELDARIEVDPEARRNPLPGNYVDRLKRLSAEAGFGERSNLQYGWGLR